MEEQMQMILREALQRVVPDAEERQSTWRITKMLQGRLEASIVEKGLQATVNVGGSVAKDTWLKMDVDIDFFILFPEEMDREILGKMGLEIAYEAVVGYDSRERFAEHPYLESWVNGIRVNIVPCYEITNAHWKSAADRSPYHTKYIQGKLKDKPSLAHEIRLLKRFMKGIEIYGAEIKVQGFSGYLCELMIISYGSFLDTLKHITKWRFGEILDVEKLYLRDEKLRKFFEAPLVVVDPIDMKRNVAAAVSKKCISELIAASRFFLKKPSILYFFPKEETPTRIVLEERLNNLCLVVLGIVLKTEEKPPDTLWGELRKTAKAISNLLNINGFNVMRVGAWSDEEQLSMILTALESRDLPTTRKHIGPPGDCAETITFLKKYEREAVTGPWLEDDRWIVGARRHYTDIIELLTNELTDGGRSIGVSAELVEAVKNAQFFLGSQLLNVSPSEDYRYGLARFIEGRPIWLNHASSLSSS